MASKRNNTAVKNDAVFKSIAAVTYCRTCINAGKEVYENVFYCPYLGHGTHSQVNCVMAHKKYVPPKKWRKRIIKNSKKWIKKIRN